MSECLFWLIGRGASISCNLSWVVPEIIKELREDEKLGRLYGQSGGSYGKLDVSEETMGSISDELTCIVKDENQESSDGLDLTEDRYNFFFNNMNDALIILNKFGKIIDIKM